MEECDQCGDHTDDISQMGNGEMLCDSCQIASAEDDDEFNEEFY